MNTHLLTLSAIALSLGLTAPAYANGFSVFGGISSTTQEFNHSRNTGSNLPNVGAGGGPSNTVSDQDTGIGFFGGVGYKQEFSNEFFGRVDAFYSTEDANTTIINNVLINEVDLNATYGADIKLGLDVTDKFSVYGLSGLTAYDFDSQISYTFAPPMDAVSETEWAFTYGAGVEIALSDRLSSFGEVRISNDVDFATPVDRGGITSQNELDYTVIRSGIRFSF